jgi:hypothetical protein
MIAFTRAGGFTSTNLMDGLLFIAPSTTGWIAGRARPVATVTLATTATFASSAGTTFCHNVPFSISLFAVSREIRDAHYPVQE